MQIIKQRRIDSSLFFYAYLFIFKEISLPSIAMRNFLILFSLLFFFSCKTEKKKEKNHKVQKTDVEKAKTLIKLWETDTVLTTCESVLYDSENDVLYVANIGGVPPDAQDNDGFISKLSVKGEILDLKWVEGIDAPKGMGLVGDKLVVTNIDEVVEIDIASGAISNKIPVEGAEFLNDITVATDGTLYISDNRSNKIYSLKEGKINIWLEKEDFGGPNGLLSQGDKLMAVTFGSGSFMNINTGDKTIRELANGLKGGDGIAAVGENYLVSSWHGEVYFVDQAGSNTKLLDTKDQKINAADIDYIEDLNMLLVPTFFGNKVVAYKLD